MHQQASYFLFSVTIALLLATFVNGHTLKLAELFGSDHGHIQETFWNNLIAIRESYKSTTIESGNLRKQDIGNKYPKALKRPENYYDIVRYTLPDCSGDLTFGYSVPLGICNGPIQFGPSGSYMQALEGRNIVTYTFIDKNCTEPDVSFPPIAMSVNNGCNDGGFESIKTERPRHPYTAIVKYYSHPDCSGRPWVFWQLGGSNCVYMRAGQNKEANIPMSIDCFTGTYNVFGPDDTCFGVPISTGSVHSSQYYDTCVGDYEYPLIPHVIQKCGGYGYSP